MPEMIVGGAEAAANLRKQLADVFEANNPAIDQQAALTQRAPRVPMSELRQRLQVPPIPGYRLYWFKEENVPAAIDAYYEFVKRHEISTNPLGIGNSVMESGNTDLGSNVSLIAGQNAAGHPVRLILMKLRMEYFREDQRTLEQRNSHVMQAIFGDEAKVFDKDGNIRDMDPLSYRKTALFNRPKRQAARPGAEARELKARLERLERQAKDK